MDFTRAILCCALVAGFAAAAHPSVLIEMEDQAAVSSKPQIERSAESETMAADRRAMKTVQRRLQETMIPVADFRDVTVREALVFLNQKTGVPMVLLSLLSPDESQSPEHLEKGAPIIPGLSMEQSPTPAHPLSEARITLVLKNVPAAEVLRYVTTLSGLTHRIEPGAVLVMPLTAGVHTTQSEEVSTGDEPAELRSIQKWRQTLEKTMARKVEIQDASMVEVLRELRVKAQCGAEAQVDPRVQLNFSMTNVPVMELLRRIAEQTKTQAVIGSGIVVFAPPAGGILSQSLAFVRNL